MSKILPILIIVILTAAIFVITKNPYTSPFKLQMMLVSLVSWICYGFYIRKRASNSLGSTFFVYLSVVTVLFLVGSTGWFFSPFFFTLYLSVFLLSFSISLPVSLAYGATLVLLFAFNIGEVNLAYDFLIVLSLLTTIPLSIYLRKEYLKLKESEKEILILKKEKEYYKSKVEEVLSNTMINFAANLKQPINDIKQLSYRLDKIKDKEEKDQYQERLINSSEEALRYLKEFEQEVTGKTLVTTPKTS